MCLAIPGKILEIQEGPPLQRKGKVSFGGTVREVWLGYVPEAKIGDYVNVHAGFAITIINEKEAAKTLAAWNLAAEQEAKRRVS